MLQQIEIVDTLGQSFDLTAGETPLFEKGLRVTLNTSPLPEELILADIQINTEPLALIEQQVATANEFALTRDDLYDMADHVQVDFVRLFELLEHADMYDTLNAYYRDHDEELEDSLREIINDQPATFVLSDDCVISLSDID